MPSTTFSVVNKFTAVDKVSGAFKNMSKAADRFGKKSEFAFNRSSKAANRFKDVTKGILAAGGISRGLGLIEQGAAAAAVSFVDFDQAITAASAKFKGLDLTTNKGLATLNKLKEAARSAGATTQFSAAQAAQGLDFLALAGFTAEQAMASLSGTINLATVANVDLGMATDIATDSLGAFGLMTKDSIQLQKNLTRVNDVMAKTMATSNTNLEQLFESVAAGAADFTTAGQSMETFSALAGIMANAGKKGEASGTALRNIMVRLAAPTGEAAKILKRFGVVTKDQNGNFRDVVDILEDFQGGMKGMGTAQKTAAISTVFGLRAQGALNILLKAGTKQMRDYRQTLIDAAGSSQKMADIMRGSLLNRLKSLGSALTELTFKIFVNFEKRGGSAIDAITEAVRKFDPQPIINGFERLIVAVKFIGALAPLIKVAAMAWIGYRSALIAAAVAQGLLTAATKTYVAFGAVSHFLKMTKALRFSTIAMIGFNTVMAANPIGLIIAGVVALGAAIFTVVQNWDAIVNGITEAISLADKFFSIGGDSAGSTSAPVGNGNPNAQGVPQLLAPNKEEKTSQLVAPNKETAEAKAQTQKTLVEGLFSFENAPEGMKFQSTGANKIDTAGLGANP